MGLGHAGDARAQMPLPWPREAQCPPPHPFIPDVSPILAPTALQTPLTFFLGLALFHPVRHLPQGVEEEIPLLLADDLGGMWREAQVEGFWGAPS